MPYGADMDEPAKAQRGASPQPFCEVTIDKNTGSFYACNILDGGVVRIIATDYITQHTHCFVHCFVTPTAAFNYERDKGSGGTIKIGG